METRIREPLTQSQDSHLLFLPEHVLFGSMLRYWRIFIFLSRIPPNVDFQALKGIPTCYIFSCQMENTCPYHALVPSGPSREPGLILLSIKGQIRFWDNIGIGLAGGDHYSVSFLPLNGLEYISNFIRADVSRVF